MNQFKGKKAFEYSLGIELTSIELIDRLETNKTLDALDHLQLTLPSDLEYSKVSALLEIQKRSGKTIIVHSNLLNTHGDNDFSFLSPIGQSIRAIESPFIVEHFTLFRDEQKLKRGVYAPNSADRKKVIQNSIDNVNKWRDITGTDVSLENIPVVENVTAYFEMLLTVSEATGCMISIDLPHLLISSLSSKYSPFDIVSVCNQMKPVQVHLASIKKVSTDLFDNHFAIDPWLCQFAKSVFGSRIKYTFEQDSSISEEVLSSAISNFHSSTFDDPVSEIASKYSDYCGSIGIDESTANNRLSDCAARTICLGMGERRNLGLIPSDSDIRMFDDITPFSYNAQKLISVASSLSTRDLFRSVVMLGDNYARYSSWWNKKPLQNRFFVKLTTANRESEIYRLSTSGGVKKQVPVDESVFKFSIQLTSSEGDQVQLNLPSFYERSER